MKIRKFKYFACDFETTVYKDQEFTEVWSAACVELFNDDVKIFHSISEQFDYFISLNENVVAYYHNLKFDGAFWLSFLMLDKKFEQAFDRVDENNVVWKRERNMKNNTFKYSISDRGLWYTIIIKVKENIIEIRDSLKLLPFSLKRIGESFETKHKKLSMEYEGFRYSGCEITNEEKEYIANDVLVLKEALEIMFNEGHNKLTIGACCLSEYKSIVKDEYRDENLFPDLYKVKVDNSEVTVGDWIRKSYKGGWCYLVEGKENKIFTNGYTFDVNSLYPSVMSSESGNGYPVGKPTFWFGNYIPDLAINENKYFFIKIKTRFYIKKNMLPFIQIKSNSIYRPNECLKSSDIYDIKNNKYYSHFLGIDNEIKDTRVELTLTMTDFYLFLEHYNVVDFEIIEGCFFDSKIGIFDTYIDKYREIKMNSKGAKRELAKLFLNNLYGKMAAGTSSSFKLAYLKDDGTISYTPIEEHKKKPGYIPIGSAITSYARNFTIRAAQQNYYGSDKPGFIYADTDSIHCDLDLKDVRGIKLDNVKFNHWKCEAKFDLAFYARQKTYIEHIVEENITIDGDKVDSNKVEPYYNIKCAGMPDRCKKFFEIGLTGRCDIDTDKLSKDEYNFIFDKDGNIISRDIKDFKNGLIIPGKLIPKKMRGGIVLTTTTYEMR
nr:MAG TPA: DNA polymerase B [Caudoviricetes sp.]